MPVRNVVTKNWSILPSFDGLLYSAYPNGDKPGGSPIIAFTDFTAGPTTGGENNKGCYLTVFGWNFGTFSAWGVSNHLYIGGVEVDNYRCLDNAPGTGVAGMGNGVFETFGLKRLTVQVGALGTPTAGVALNITMTVNGHGLANPVTSGQYFDYLSGDALTFTPQPGTILFVDQTNGLDSNAGTFAAPKQHLQDSTMFGSGALKSASSSVDTSGTKPGTHIVFRGGTYTSTGTTTGGSGTNYGMWANLFRIGGLAPSGGTNRGPICFTSYPGAAGANSRELAQYNPGTGVHASGGFLGNDQARAQETNPFDGTTVGWCKYMHFSNLKITAAADYGQDGAPFNLNSRADFWRIMGCEMIWKTTITDAVNGANTHARAGGIAGNGRTVRIGGNYIHDIWGDVAFNENHGTYFDGSVESANGVYMGFNVIYNITAGNGIQTYNAAAPDYIQNIYDHNNWIELVNKNGINCSDNTRSRHTWNTVVKDAGEYGIYYSSASLIATNAQSVENCVIYGWARQNSLRPGVGNTGNTGTGSTMTRNCIFFQPSGYNTAGGFTSLDGSGTNNLDNNQWFDANGVLTTQPSGDTTGGYGNPKFNAAASKDFSLQSTSPCINVGSTTIATRNYDFIGFVIIGLNDRGAFEYGSHL
jgi:hypothetical protein